MDRSTFEQIKVGDIVTYTGANCPSNLLISGFVTNKQNKEFLALDPDAPKSDSIYEVTFFEQVDIVPPKMVMGWWNREYWNLQ